ncbi:MAG: orotidine-5'-phosphate decarboxylase [Acidimicrobiales bacterium]
MRNRDQSTRHADSGRGPSGRDDPSGREKLALALDVADREAAVRLANRLRPWFGVVKVGLELFVAEGPDVVRALVGEGFDVFLDLKVHDIPNTAARAAARAASTGARYLTAHAGGGEAMLHAAVDAWGSSTAQTAKPGGILAVTVLTSDPAADRGALEERAARARRTGCTGIVCAADDLAVLAEQAARLLKVVPGIRSSGTPAGDQARVATPATALALGADLLVVGRTVTGAEDVESAARALAAEVAQNSPKAS